MADFSDEQILALIRDAETKTPEVPAGVELNLGDGTVLKAANQEELAKLVAAKIAEVSKRPEAPKPTPAPAAPNAPPVWDMKTFVDKFTDDPDAGLEYMEMAKYGMPVRKAVPQMIAVIQAMAQKVQELETNSFAPSDAAERTAVQKVMQERGWQASRQSYADALVLAKASGLIETKQETPRNERGQFVPREDNVTPFIPPRIPRTTGGPEAPDEVLRKAIEAAQTMPLDKLQDLLRQSGHFKA